MFNMLAIARFPLGHQGTLLYPLMRWFRKAI